MLIAWPRWLWMWNQWQQWWPQHGILFCFLSVVWRGKGTVELREEPVFVWCNCVDVCYFGGSAKVMALSPKAWIHLSSDHMRNCCQASISLERARKNSVCWLGGMWWRIGGSRSRSGHRWMTNGVAISIVDGATEGLIFCCNFYCRLAPLMMMVWSWWVFNFDDGGVWLLVWCCSLMG